LRRFIRIVLLSVIGIFLIMKCPYFEEKSQSRYLNIMDARDYPYLCIQSAAEKGMIHQAGSLGEIISDEAKIKAFINIVNDIEMVSVANNALLNQMNKQNEQNGKPQLTFLLSESEAVEDAVYKIEFTKNGAVQIQDPDHSGVVYRSKDNHPELLKELQELLGFSV
jgi:hypothetical protein